MNILFTAPANDFTTQMLHALREEGHDAVHLEMRRNYALPAFFQKMPMLWRMSRRIQWLREYSGKSVQRRVREALERRPDLLLAFKGMDIWPETLAYARSKGVPSAVWFHDNAANEPYAAWVRNAADDWDHFFSFDSAITAQMPLDRRARVHVLPFGVEPGAFSPGALTDEDRKRFSCDVCFVGAPYPERVELLQSVRDREIRIWGWEGWKRTPLARFYRGPLDAKGSAKAYRLAKICMNTNILPHANGVNLKTFEICASGGFQLTDELPDLAGSFEVGAELDVFRGADQFRRKVDHWLAHDEARARIAAAGRERVLREHTLRTRVRELLASIHR